MNRKVLGLAITALLAANAANAAEIYNKDGNKVELTGKVTAEYEFRDETTPRFGGHQPNALNTEFGDKNSNVDATYARLGFIGETQINSELTGYAKFEHNFNAEAQEATNDEEDGTRYAYVGLKFGNYGSLDFGRNLGVVDIVKGLSNVAVKFDGDGGVGGTDLFMTGRAASLVTYSNKDFFGMVPGWDFYLQYQAENIDGDASFKKDNGDGLGFTTTYHHADTGLSAGFTYASSDRTNEQVRYGKNGGTWAVNPLASAQRWTFDQVTGAPVLDTVIDPVTGLPVTNMSMNSADGERAEVWGLGGRYDANNILFGVSWQQSNNMYDTGIEIANKTRGFEISAGYAFDFGLTPTIVYGQLRGRDLHGFAKTAENPDGLGSSYLKKSIGIGAEYTFNKNLVAGIGYKINLLDEEGEYVQRAQLDTDDVVNMSLSYSF